MKINIDPVIINGTGFVEWAVEQLVDESFSRISPRIRHYPDRMDFMDYVHDIIVDEMGVSIPTEYEVTYKGTDRLDDPDEIAPVDYEIMFSPEELRKMVLTLIKEEEPEAYDAYVSVMTKKN